MCLSEQMLQSRAEARSTKESALATQILDHMSQTALIYLINDIQKEVINGTVWLKNWPFRGIRTGACSSWAAKWRPYARLAPFPLLEVTLGSRLSRTTSNSCPIGPIV